MTAQPSSEIDQFILDEIDSVPHLEALLLLWNSRPRQSSIDEVAKALYIPAEQALPIVRDLNRRGLIECEEDTCWFNQEHPRSEMIERVDRTYRREVVRISTLIHSKPSAALRAFARAFKLTKD